ncbi:MAG TPA: M13 family metallopeptidase [Solimonas sp.]|nr:M13 family metallopeptidase [Solimonas sp.]
MNKFLLGAACALALSACGKKTEAPAPKPTPAAAPVAAAPKALASGIDKANFDDKVRPQDDLFRYVNGTWLAKTEIPADKSNYGAFSILDDRAEEDIKAIIEEAAASKAKQPGSNEQRIGDFYAAFMDEAKADELGLKPLEPTLAKIDAIKDRKELGTLLGELSTQGLQGFFPGYIEPDAKDSTKYVVYLFQGGTGLPDRDYYLSKDAKFADIRAKYLAHIEKMLTMAGVKDAGKAAKDIVALETRLAEKQWTKVESRDAEKTYNPYSFEQLAKLSPGFDWPAYIKASGIEASPGLVIGQPSFFTAFDKALAGTPLPLIQNYLKWHALRSFSPFLSKPYVDENFAFYSQTLRGIKENRVRWKRSVEATENALGEALGKIYVAKHFPPQAKERMDAMVQNLVKAYEESIRNLDWMSEETRQKALAKLAKFTPKIGYPTKWKDYSALSVSATDLLGNVMRSNAVENAREAAKLGKPIDRELWLMTPQTINAYYNPSQNEIVFPAAILQPPFFNLTADDAVNYGGIGAVIGHEVGHGFDDQGSKYDGDGNLRSWWTEADRKAFETRTKALIAQYDAFEPLPGQHVQGALTIGENIGDLGGLSIAYKAWKASLNGAEPPVIDGLTGDQRFFMGWAQVWARKYRDEELLNRLKTDPHSPSEFRTNGIVANLPAFYSAFDVKEGDKLFLAPEKRVRIW